MLCMLQSDALTELTIPQPSLFPQDIPKHFFCVIQKALHTIKTGCGVSDLVYGDKMIPLAVCDQENGVGPILRALVSSAIIKMCNEKGHRIKIATTIIKMILSLQWVLHLSITQI